jgi:hypothetical protein
VSRQTGQQWSGQNDVPALHSRTHGFWDNSDVNLHLCSSQNMTPRRSGRGFAQKGERGCVDLQQWSSQQNEPPSRDLQWFMHRNSSSCRRRVKVHLGGGLLPTSHFSIQDNTCSFSGAPSLSSQCSTSRFHVKASMSLKPKSDSSMIASSAANASWGSNCWIRVLWFNTDMQR